MAPDITTQHLTRRTTEWLVVCKATGEWNTLTFAEGNSSFVTVSHSDGTVGSMSLDNAMLTLAYVMRSDAYDVCEV